MWVAAVRGIFPKIKLTGTPLMVAMVIHLMLPLLTEVMTMLRKNPIPIK
jgi:hypothetical protein